MTKKKREAFNTNWLENDLSKSTTLTLSVRNLDDYRCIPLYPTLEDVISNRGLHSLRANNVNSPYRNCNEYLDIFFRLMREDFVSVVRDTLKYLKKLNNNGNGKLDIVRIWHFKNVKIHSIKSFQTIFFRFDTPDHAQFIDYENSKQFKNGALVLLSEDQFTTFTLGIVTNTSKLNFGIVGIDVIGFEKVRKWRYIELLEPTVFYEPYRYVMGVFQDMFEKNFPMKNYIVYGIKNISFPSYLAGNSIYTINGIEFDVLQNDQWPSAEVLSMDINQYKALKGALTKEFAMIQGPPGTGKTYIGLEIVKIIITNLYDTKKLTNPIMVVCMTNHALDQFLEGIWKITRNISRFGYGTKSDILVKYIPKMYAYKMYACADEYVHAKRDVYASIQKEKLHLFNIKEVNLNEGVIDLSYLTEIISVKGFNNWFKDSYDLFSWLLSDISNVNGVNPIDFIKRKKLLTHCSTKLNDQTENKLYCINLKGIKLYCTQLQYKLDSLKNFFNEDDGNDDNVSKQQDLELELKIMKTVEHYIIKHLKLFEYESFVECNNKLLNRDLLKQRDRWLLYYNWVNLFLTQEKIIIENLQENTRQCRRDINKFKSIGYLKSVKNKHVIGMTTTAAARNRYLLKNLKCPIVIIEEAAEVLEPHIVASMSEYCKHLILIGDHKQLRPHTANHKIAQKYKLDVSLFERMVNNKIPSYVLAEQHRMRPEIAGLVAPAIYSHLRNHPSVMDRPHVRGLDKDVFCITHNKNEEKNYELSSYINSIEANLLVELANYLLKQGYYPEDITIMAMYNAQVLYISELVNSSRFEQLKDIRVSSVDGYQGEENEIVLLSLVRSNTNNSIGFLKTNNRVCVALSRARLGFYIAGNLNLLASASELWKSVKNYLCNLNALGPKLLLKCQIHNKCIGNVSNGLDFGRLTGCKLKCNAKLLCGHFCNRVCHIEDIDHLTLKCTFACEKKCIRNHICRKMCYEECNRCQDFSSIFGKCGHSIQGKCCDVENMKCQIKVKEKLDCGHTLDKLCYQPSVCNKICNKPNSNCLFGHLCKKPCSVACNSCIHPIPIVMKCGHISKYVCSQEPDFVECTECKAEIKRAHTPANLVSAIPKNANDEFLHDQIDTNVLADRTNLQNVSQQLVSISYKFYCGHVDKLDVPHHLTVNNSSALEKWCKNINALKLKCGHKSYALCGLCTKTNKKHKCKKCIKKSRKSFRTKFKQK